MSILKAKKSDGGWEEIHSIKAMTQSTNDFTQDATATANDMTQGVTAYVKGQKITGTIPVDLAPIREPEFLNITSNYFVGGWATKEKIIIDSDMNVGIMCDASEFGDAATSDVLSGKTFTSANGLKLTGTYVPSTTTVNLQTKTVSPTTSKQIVKPDSGYTGLSQVTVNAMASGGLGTPSISVAANGVITATANVVTSGYLATGTTTNNTLTLSSAHDSDFVASNIRSGKTIFGVTGTYTGTAGIDTSDATATASDLPSGVTAYAKGQKITGTLLNVADGELEITGATATTDSYSGVSHIKLTRTVSDDMVLRKGLLYSLATPLANLGNATAADVAAGKTFTSASGLNVTGTLPINSSFVQNDCNLTMYNNKLNMWTRNTSGANYAITSNGVVDLYCSGDKLGDARPEDVVAGKTFTSSYGLKVSGTGSSSGGSDVTNFTVINSGTYESDANVTSAIVINHNCYVIPDVIVFMEDPTDLNMSSTVGAIAYQIIAYQPFVLNSTQYYGHYYLRYQSSTTGFSSSANSFFSGSNMITSSTFRVECSTARKLIAGRVYKWAAIKFK